MSRKGWTRGTHRVCSPDETLASVLHLLPAAGITRIGDVTRLDSAGIYTYQAIRPNSRNISVSLGKGVTRPLAKVSALMEAIELWHAEVVGEAPVQAAISELGDRLTYDPYDLPRPPDDVLHSWFRMDWLNGRHLLTGQASLVPREHVELDFVARWSWHPPLFLQTTNGLASGNCFEEAVLHGLYELIERHCQTLQLGVAGDRPHLVRLDTVVEQDNRRLIDTLEGSGNRVEIADITSDIDVPCFRAAIWAETFPIWTSGGGCHLDRDVALSRALTEAAQSRLAYISGARDDLKRNVPPMLRNGQLDRRVPPVRSASVSWKDLPASEAGDDLETDLFRVAQRVEKATGIDPMVVDLTRAAVGIPVVKVVAPGLAFELEVL